MLLVCAQAAIGDQSCEWYVTPPKPGSPKAEKMAREQRQAAASLPEPSALRPPDCSLVSTTVSCVGWEDRP